MAANLEPTGLRATGRVATVAILILAAAFALLGIERTGAAAQTFTVIGTADTGGTCPTISTCAGLRQAILSANGNAGADTIVFNIAGSGPHIFTPATAFPVISEAVTIDGFCANCDGATANHTALFQPITAIYKIILDGPGGSTNGIIISSPTAVTIKGLVMHDFGGNAIQITTGTGHTIKGNFLGTNAAGTAKLNQSGGAIVNGSLIKISGTTSNVAIGGSSPADRNLISGSGADGIANGSAGTVATGLTVRGNYIGTNAAGTAAIANAASGIVSVGTGFAVGGTAAGEGNLISGNSFGLNMGPAASGVIQGNRIGTNAAGTAAVGNITGILAVLVNSTIGSTSASGRNLVAGNTGNGMLLSDSVGLDVTGNYLGVDVTGTLKLPNRDTDVNISSGSDIDIGVAGAGGGNLFGGDTASAGSNKAIRISGTWTNVRVTNNTIGIGTGGQNIGHKGQGLDASGTGSNLNVTGNTFVSSNSEGIRVVLDSVGSGLVIRGNFVGVTPALEPRGTNSGGLLLANVQGVVGGPLESDANYIAYNALDGIAITTAGNVTITRNHIFGNGSNAQNIGIDLGNDGTPANDNLDADTGPNGLLNRPEVNGFVYVDGDHVILPLLIRSLPNHDFKVEFFRNTTCKSNGNGQGEFFAGETILTTGASGLRGLPVDVQGVAFGEYIAATITDEAGNTSEFSSGFECNQVHRPFLDVNCDFDVSAADALAVMNYLAGIDVGNVAQECEQEPAPSAGDANQDFQENIRDAISILRYEAGLEDILGNEIAQ